MATEGRRRRGGGGRRGGSSDRRARNRLGRKATIIYRERCANVFHRRQKWRGRSIKPGPFVLWLRLFCVLPLPWDARASWPDLARPPMARVNRGFILRLRVMFFSLFSKFLTISLPFSPSSWIGFKIESRQTEQSNVSIASFRDRGSDRLDFKFHYSSAISWCVRTVRTRITALSLKRTVRRTYRCK